MRTRLLPALLRRAAHPPHAYTTAAAAAGADGAVAHSLQDTSRGRPTELDLSGQQGKPHEDLVCVNIMCERVRAADARCAHTVPGAAAAAAGCAGEAQTREG
jgi:hypothetical protein